MGFVPSAVALQASVVRVCGCPPELHDHIDPETAIQAPRSAAIFQCLAQPLVAVNATISGPGTSRS
jgi:hypothetical protein